MTDFRSMKSQNAKKTKQNKVKAELLYPLGDITQALGGCHLSEWDYPVTRKELQILKSEVTGSGLREWDRSSTALS